MINLQKLMDDTKGDETVRERRWLKGGCGPPWGSIEVTTPGRDTPPPARQKYRCKGCDHHFDDLTGTVFAGHRLKESAPFIFHLKFPANYEIAPHTHPATENVTVISGTLVFRGWRAGGSRKARTLPPGSVAVMPAEHPMFGWTKEEEVIIQVHGIGPWSITYLNPEDDPRNK
jgi:hypothetical protein